MMIDALPPGRAGILAAVLAYGLWGFFPVYFKQLGSLPPIDIVAWRIVFACLTLVLAMAALQGVRSVWRRIASVQQWGLAVAATLLIAANWFVFVYAISVDQILQGSLGYFLVPLINSALGMLVFGERPNRLKQLALLVAVIGMIITFIVAGIVPVLSLLLALSFGLYGLIKKRTADDNATGLLVETVLLAPLAVVFLYVYGAPLSAMPDDAARYWLYAGGLFTVVPLFAMGFAARRIELGTLGFVQYLTPTMQFLIAITVYGEHIDLARGMAFVTTLLAVALWLAGSVQGRRLSLKHS